MNAPLELKRIYQRRFATTSAYRNQVWQVLTRTFFRRWIEPQHSVLDLGCGYGEFINNIVARTRFAMDLNSDARHHLADGVQFLEQDCSQPWDIPDEALDVVFTSNFFEHLPNKKVLSDTLRQALRCLRPGGRLIAMGPNIRYLGGQYWDFYDHHTPLTEASLGEALELEGFELDHVIPKFLPYTLVGARQYPTFLVRLYLLLPFAWRILGRQFLVISRKPRTGSSSDGA